MELAHIVSAAILPARIGVQVIVAMMEFGAMAQTPAMAQEPATILAGIAMIATCAPPIHATRVLTNAIM